ncbi:MAG TPA: rhodanese-like domain-containing protein [Pyrinomonadaceae bacterium]|nr:rhodanese-like domain-containing protein [Pyrinomonadaceae bacterium]
MRSLISMVSALGLSACALLAACSPQDGSAPANTSSSRSAPAPATATATNDTGAQTTKQAPAPTPAADETRRISIEETQASIAAGNALIVDVRDESVYKASHIKGAKNIPLSRFDQRTGELPKDKLIITYCA